MKHMPALTVALALSLPLPAGAQSQPGSPQDPPPSATDRLQEGALAIVEGLRLLMDQLQSYQPPEILPNGDIIIRRRAPEEQAPPTPPAKPESGGDKPLRL